MAENKKIRNANPKEYDSIKFKSISEVMVYKTLLAEGFNPEYEKHTYSIWENDKPTVPFYTKNKFKRKNKHIEVISKHIAKDMRPLTKITYTPDFVFNYKDKTIIVEVKGYENDVFPYKFKMFRKYMQINYDINKVEIWEVFTKTQLLELIKQLKNNYNNDVQ